jgi:hypothetical protein
VGGPSIAVQGRTIMSTARPRILRTLAVICGVLVLCSLLGCEQSRPTEISRDFEQARVSSPSGLLDAVLVREDGGGAAGGWEWYVYIVPKGSPVNSEAGPTFNAGTLTGCKLTWTSAHLLDIHYDVVHINQFSNLWNSREPESLGNAAAREYLVEIRLVPSSPDYSLLTPNGTFKPKDQ